MGVIFDSWFQNVGLLLSLIFIYASYKLWKCSEYFSKNRFYSIPLWESTKYSWYLLSGKEHFVVNSARYFDYLKTRGYKIGGAFQFFIPVYIVTEPELAQKILVKDFSHFHDHGIDKNEELNPLENHLFNLNGGEWKTMRNKLTPIFTSGKLKWMYSHMTKCTEDLIKILKKETKPGEDTLIREFLSRHSIDVISNCAFGIDSNALFNPDSEIRKMALKLFKSDGTTVTKLLFVRIFPKIAKALKIKTFSAEVEDFFFSLTKQVFEHRRKTKDVRNDIVQLLLELKEKGSLEMGANDEDEVVDGATLGELTDELLTAQVFIFLVAGWENATIAAAFGLYFLAKNPNLQKRARDEIREKIAKHDGQLTYDALKEMKFLDKCVAETLRLEPPGAVMRMCTKEYTLEDGRKIEKNSRVLIPVNSFHLDPDNFPDPLKFDPDRFEQGSQKMTATYFPFGNGPRVCIAQRFSLLQINLTLAAVLNHFEVEVSPKLQEPLKRNPSSFQADVIGGMWLRLKPLS